ncbi:acyl-CoA dehydrogenase [Nocardioides sp. BP30]|uniref:acyl-CoA dehydrogenase n=1 Tax=Nocardioides sp. BP30 TaxID=3036374 RepID=UPI0024698578|nr:acyl-CoA dehydrogenase [Nocardioides sp. BP30]WGL54101.1 acyl-CoA dehydrogenase [Nocardioides sp. BP30]
MALAITEDHEALAQVATSYLERVEARAAARATLEQGASGLPDMWTTVAQMGWLGLHLREEYGGSGYGLAELAVVLEGLGHELAPGPFLPTVACSALVAAAASVDVRAALLPGLADGTRVGAVGLAPGLTLSADGRLAGESRAVLGAPDAHVLGLVVGADVVLIDTDTAGVAVRPDEGLDSTRSIGTVVLDSVPVEEDRVLVGAARRAVTIFRILMAAEGLGSIFACVESATSYAKVREQFGRPIGTFQAVKHHLANMLVDAELTAAATWDAARSIDLDEAWFAAAVAATHTVRAQVQTARLNIQLHGGIGFTWEHDAHLYLRRAETVAALLRDGRDPVADVVEAHRTGTNHGALFELPAESESYRAEARVAAAKARSLAEEERRSFLVDSGYLVPHWRAPWGRGAGVVEQLVIEEEFAGIDIPDTGISGWISLTISQEGTEEQQARWIDDVLRGRTNWCQLFSEPDAGSDAAAVRTAGRRVDGGWIVNGQKVWTSTAASCQWGLATVRTDPTAAKHAGVTMMAIDMGHPGVEVRPLRELNGDALFNEVFLTDVFVPDADVVGDEGAGWKVARATLGNERFSIGGGSGSIAYRVDDLMELLDKTAGLPAYAEHEVGLVLVEAHTLRLLNLRQASRALAGVRGGPEANITKLVKAEHSQRLTNLAMHLAGTAAVTGHRPEVTNEYLFSRCLTIAGGTSEIMRNTIAERLLGLPRDPLAR